MIFLPGFYGVFSMPKCFQNRRQTSEWQMIVLAFAAFCCMAMHHFYYSFLNDQSPSSPVSHASWITDQSVVSDIGIALAYAGQTLLGAALSISSSQLFWRSLRVRGHSITQLDALMKTQVNPVSLSLFRCGRASLPVILAAFVSVSMPLVSVFAPNSIKVSFDRSQSTECMVKTPRNLTALTTSNSSDYTVSVVAVLASGTYLPPASTCNTSVDVESPSQCSYDISFVGPGLIAVT